MNINYENYPNSTNKHYIVLNTTTILPSINIYC